MAKKPTAGIHNPFQPLETPTPEADPDAVPGEVILDGDSYWIIFQDDENSLKSRLVKLFYEVNKAHPNILPGLGVYVYDKTPERLPPHEKVLATDGGSLVVFVDKLDDSEAIIYRRLGHALYTIADHKLYKQHKASVRKIH